jgi:hypothetical protein
MEPDLNQPVQPALNPDGTPAQPTPPEVPSNPVPEGTPTYAEPAADSQAAEVADKIGAEINYIDPSQVTPMAAKAVATGGKAWLWWTIAGVITTLVIMSGGIFYFYRVKGTSYQISTSTKKTAELSSASGVKDDKTLKVDPVPKIRNIETFIGSTSRKTADSPDGKGSWFSTVDGIENIIVFTDGKTKFVIGGSVSNFSSFEKRTEAGPFKATTITMTHEDGYKQKGSLPFNVSSRENSPVVYIVSIDL